MNRSVYPEWSQSNTDPYFFRNSNVRSGKMAIIQNVENGDLDQSLYVAVKWVEKDKEHRTNVGYSPQVDESDIEDHAYVVYHEDHDEIEKVAGEGRTASVVQYNDGNYAAVLFL